MSKNRKLRKIEKLLEKLLEKENTIVHVTQQQEQQVETAKQQQDDTPYFMHEIEKIESEIQKNPVTVSKDNKLEKLKKLKEKRNG